MVITEYRPFRPSHVLLDRFKRARIIHLDSDSGCIRSRSYDVEFGADPVGRYLDNSGEGRDEAAIRISVALPYIEHSRLARRTENRTTIRALIHGSLGMDASDENERGQQERGLHDTILMRRETGQ